MYESFTRRCSGYSCTAQHRAPTYVHALMYVFSICRAFYVCSHDIYLSINSASRSPSNTIGRPCFLYVPYASMLPPGVVTCLWALSPIDVLMDIRWITGYLQAPATHNASSIHRNGLNNSVNKAQGAYGLQTVDARPRMVRAHEATGYLLSRNTCIMSCLVVV